MKLPDQQQEFWVFIRVPSIILLAVTLHAAHMVYRKSIPAYLLSLDPAGNVYVGNTSGLTKLDPNGNTVYTTQLLATFAPVAMAADGSGGVILIGSTNSGSLPTTPGVFQPKRSPGVCVTGDRSAQPYPCPDAFVVRMDAGGNLAWASYLGGLGIELAYGVAVDQAGSVYVTGLTQSADFPTVNPFQSKFGGYADAFITKISADGSRILYSSTLGGAGYDRGIAVAVDSSGNAYVAGEMQGTVDALASAGFGHACGASPVNDYLTRAYLIKVSSGGDHLAFEGCLAAAGYSTATAVTLDRQGNVYVGGSANNKTFSVTPGAFNSADSSPYATFVEKVAADGSSVAYSALFPGGSFGVTSIAVDANGSAYLLGDVEAERFPIAGPAMQPCPASNGLEHNFLLKLKADGSAPVYSSFEASSRLALAPDGSLYLGGSSLRKLTALDVPGDSFLTPYCVLNAASLASHVAYGQPGISPGEIVTLKGTGLGPITPPDPVVVNGLFATSLGGTQVFFDDMPAALLYVQAGQINAVAPYGLAGKTETSIQVRYRGQTTDRVPVPVSTLSPTLFRSADGTPIVLNADYSVNSRANPAARGSILILYMTGAGQTDPPSLDGQIWTTTGGLQMPVSAQIKNYGDYGEVTATVPVLYAGPVPSLVSGVEQFNIQIPRDLGDSFVTQTFLASTVVILQIGPQQSGYTVFVR